MAATITLRARWFDHDPKPGMLFASPDGRLCYRVLDVTRVHTVGEPKKNHHRLVCERLSAAPEGAEVRPWPRDPRAPRQRRPRARSTADPGPAEPASARLDRIRAKAPLLLDMAIEAIRKGRVADELARLARAARVGRDDGLRDGRDYGPGIRLRGVRGRQQGTLREADAEIITGPDPAKPNTTVTRARRCDPLVKLFRAGTIAGREVDAAEKLRQQLEAAEAGGGGGLSEIHVPAFQRGCVTDSQLLNATRARDAVISVAADNRPILLWAVSGGNVADFSAHMRVRHTTASLRLKTGLGQLADHYRLPGG